MSAADLHDLELIWPSLRPTDVIVTGTFDQWSSSIHLAKGDGGFFGTVKVPWGQKIEYKYIVDGRWQCRDDRPQEDDGYGNINNVLLTPDKPVLPTLFIPSEGAKSDGYGDVETMVTAVEFLPPAEPAAIRGSLPLPIPQITVNLSQTPTMSESKLDTAGATEGNVSPASVTPGGFAQEPSSCDVPILPVNENGSVALPTVNGNGEAHDSHSFSTHAPIQFTKEEASTFSSVAETVEAVVAPLESAVSQPNQSPQAVQDVPAFADHVDDPPAAVVEPTAKQPEADLPKTAAQGHRRQATAPASIDQASTPSSSTVAHKKRRSLFARIKHIFDKDKDKHEKKEKNKR